MAAAANNESGEAEDGAEIKMKFPTRRQSVSQAQA